MANRYFQLESGEVLTFPKSAIHRLAESRDPDAALLYLYLAAGGGAYSEENAAAALGWPVERVEEAMRTLQRLSVLRQGEEAPLQEERLSDYSAGEIAGGLRTDTAFAELVRETEQALGKVLSSADLNLLFAMYQELLLPPDVLVMLVAHCVQESQRRLGPGRKPTLRQIEREARRWARDGVNDTARADQYLRAKEQYQGKIRQMLRALQIHGRGPTETEERYLRSFIDMGFSPEAVYRAYDITLVKVGALRWSYLSAILKKWHEKGLHTPEEIEAAESAGSKKSRRKSTGDYTPGEQELRALEWLQSYHPEDGKGKDGVSE